MPRLWTETIEGHRQAVRDATIDATAALLAEQGRKGVTMSRIAEETGIGRATLYKYFADFDEILVAWHERQINAHLALLAEIRETADRPVRLERVLQTYARIRHAHPTSPMEHDLHTGEHVTRARMHLVDFLADLITEDQAIAGLRTDVPAKELATFCICALDGAADVRSEKATQRLVGLVMDALRAHST